MNETCNCNSIHAETVEAVAASLPDESLLADAADLFKVFGDTTRIRILSALLQSELCVCDIAALLNMSKSAISHQLRALRLAKLAKFRREGKVVYYSLDDEHVGAILATALDHLSE
ncbi:MAG: metalloregulator ArsR/SmtB family transcription factor [Actinomycetes bacterium]|jgi:DNA-binding transcriptional ArsR family regulator|nr:metalloregulator ArsR/SmtB family transcription factor [Actinomycetes bacterium]